jgi:MurNAc alpha-1-phosphate uridylyltransferase
MRAMILAAGRGERMGMLTAETPKPLLRAGGHYLIEYVLRHLQQAGITEIVMNVAYRGEQIQQALGNGSRYGVQIEYSVEEQRLETGGGIFKALPLLGSEPFLVMSSDVVTDFPLSTLPLQPEGLVHLVLVQNPAFHPHGDFGLRAGKVDMDAKPAHTFGNVGVYRREFFAACSPGYFPLNQILFPAIRAGLVTGECYQGRWFNIGMAEQLVEFERTGFVASF